LARYGGGSRPGYEDETQQGARSSLLCMEPGRRPDAARQGRARARARSRLFSKRRSKAGAGAVCTRTDPVPVDVDTGYGGSEDGGHGSTHSSSESRGRSRARGVAKKKIEDPHDSAEDDASLYVTEDEDDCESEQDVAIPAAALDSSSRTPAPALGSLLRIRVSSARRHGSESADSDEHRGTSSKASRRHRRRHRRRRGNQHDADEGDCDDGRKRAATAQASPALSDALAGPRARMPPLETQLLELPGGRAPIRVDPRQPNTAYVHSSGAFDLYARFYEEVCGMRRVDDPRRAGVVLGNEFELMRLLASSGWAHFHPHARVLFLPGVVLLDDKAELAALLAGASYHPTTYVNEAPETADLRGWWIDKPARGSSGRGLSIVRDPAAWKAEGHVLQRYRDDPLLHRGRYKFDLRALALVTGDGRAMVYSDAVMRCCTMPYAPVGGTRRGRGGRAVREQDVDERAHLTNVSVQAKYDRTQSHVDLLSEHAELYEALMPRVRALVHDVLARWFSRVASDDEGGLAGKQPQHQRAAAPTTSPVVSARRGGADDDATVPPAPQDDADDKPARRPRSRCTRTEGADEDGARASVVTSPSSAAQGFRIIGFDVLPLDSGDVVFVEANYQPGLGRDGKLGRFYERALQEMLRCTVDPAWAAAKLVTVCPALAEFAHDTPDAGVQRRRRGAALTVAASSMLVTDACAAALPAPLLPSAHSEGGATSSRAGAGADRRCAAGGHLPGQFGVSPAPPWLAAAVERAAQRLPPRGVADIVRGPGATLVLGTYADARAAAECLLLDPADCAAGRREGELVAYGMVEQLPPAAVGMARNRARGTRARVADVALLRVQGSRRARTAAGAEREQNNGRRGGGGGTKRGHGKPPENTEVLHLLRGPWDGAGGSSSSCVCVITAGAAGGGDVGDRGEASARRKSGSRRPHGSAHDAYPRGTLAVVCAFVADDTGRVRLDERGAVLVARDGATSAAGAVDAETEAGAWAQVRARAAEELCVAWNLSTTGGSAAPRSVECGIAVFARPRGEDSMTAVAAVPLRPAFADREDAQVLSHLLTYYRLSDLAHFCGTALASLCVEAHARARATPRTHPASATARAAAPVAAAAAGTASARRERRDGGHRRGAARTFWSPPAATASSVYEDPHDHAAGMRQQPSSAWSVKAPAYAPWAQPAYMLDGSVSATAATLDAARPARYFHQHALRAAPAGTRGASHTRASSQAFAQQQDSFRNYLGLRLTQPGRAHTGALRPADPYAW